MPALTEAEPTGIHTTSALSPLCQLQMEPPAQLEEIFTLHLQQLVPDAGSSCGCGSFLTIKAAFATTFSLHSSQNTAGRFTTGVHGERTHGMHRSSASAIQLEATVTQTGERYAAVSKDKGALYALTRTDLQNMLMGEKQWYHFML